MYIYSCFCTKYVPLIYQFLQMDMSFGLGKVLFYEPHELTSKMNQCITSEVLGKTAFCVLKMIDYYIWLTRFLLIEAAPH